jgi:tetratricopeptide (TPR) repeat protein/transcriptional regulator with XRE-family HTH domain
MKKQTKFAPNVRLKLAREQKGWSQEYVARQLGTDAFTISRWERGVAMASPYFRQQLAALFGLSVMELGLIPTETEKSPEQETAAGQSPAIEVQSSSRMPVFDPAIPPPLGHGLVGRDALLHQLKQRLLSEKPVALSAINGLPGVGKTALATALAHDEEVRASFVDGILWGGLGYEPDVLKLLSRWGGMLHCAPSDLAQRNRPEAWAESIHVAIGQRRILLIIDDVWDISWALALQVGGPNCSHLITTRFPEIARRFAGECAMVVRELADSEGRLLLMRLAPDVIEAGPQQAELLVAAAGGLPLALTLLGNFLRGQAHSGQPRRLRAALQRLQGARERLELNEPQPLVGGHPSLSAGTPVSLQVVIGLSYQQVSEEARTALRALAVFPPKPNTFSEEAALAVCALPVETLDALSDAGLLESSGTERYTLHQTIADYARTQSTDEGVNERLASYYVEFAQAHATDYAALERESDNILAALETAFERGMRPELVQGVQAFAPWLITRGLYSVTEIHLQRSLDAAQSIGDINSQANARLLLGKIAEQRGDNEQAQANWQHGLELAREHGQRNSMAQVLREQGSFAWKQGHFQEAHQLLEESLGILRQLGDRRGVAEALKSLGNLAAEQGQPEQSYLLYEKALSILQDLNDVRGIAIVKHNMGVRSRERGQPEQARALYKEALSILRSLGDQHSISVVLSNLGNLARHQGRPEQARQYLEEALLLNQQIENRRSLGFTLLNLGGLEADEGEVQQARKFLDEALLIFRELHEQRQQALTLCELGILDRKQGQFGQAHRFFEESLAIFQQLQEQRQKALALRELGTLARQQKDPEQALEYYTEALTLLSQLDDMHEAALTRQEMGILARQQGQLDVAEQLLTEALVVTREIRARQHVAHALNELGLLMQQREQPEQALPLLLTAWVGLTLVHSPEASIVKEVITKVRAQLNEKTSISIVKRLAGELPEPAYELDQKSWAAAIMTYAIE